MARAIIIKVVGQKMNYRWAKNIFQFFFILELRVNNIIT